MGGRGIQSVDAAGEGGVALYRELEAAAAGFQAALFGHVQVVAIDAGVAGTDAAAGAGAPRPGGDAKAGVLLAAVVAAAVLQAVDAQYQLLASVDVGVAGKLTVKGLSLRLSAPGFVP